MYTGPGRQSRLLTGSRNSVKARLGARDAPRDGVPRAKSALSDSDSFEDESDEEAFGWEK